MLLTPWLLPLALAVEVPPIQGGAPKVRPARKDVALVVSNQDYSALPDADHAAADGEAVAALLTGFVGVEADRVVRLRDASTAELAAAVPRVAALGRKGGTLWVFFAGHGAGGARGQRLLLGTDAAADAEALAGVSVEWVASEAARSEASRVVVVLDAGFGGLGREGEELYPGKRFVVGAEAAPADPRVTVWMATSGAEAAGVFSEAEHGLFTWSVVGALRGWADGRGGTPADRVVQLHEAQVYAAGLVRALGGSGQRPTREPRAELHEWALARVAESAPEDRVIDTLAQAARAQRIRVLQEALYVRARRDWAAVEVVLGQQKPPILPGGPADQVLRQFLARYDSATVQVDGQEFAVVVPEAALARQRLDEIARNVPKSTRKAKKSKKAPPPPPVDPNLALCQDLTALQPPALLGTLDGAQIECLERRVDTETSQTTRDKVSRVLLVNADARGDELEWARLAARHLETIDRSDPDLCLKYALVLSRGDLEDAPDVLRWADIGLENKHRWTGPTFIARVYALYRLRAEAAARLWTEAELERVDDPSAADADELALLRGRAKNYAREWLDYARASQQPTERAQQLCESAAGTAAFCAAG